MQILLIRHGEPEWIVDGLNVDNPPLTERGHAQARLMAESLRDQRYEREHDEVHCSPLMRARQTAAPLFEVFEREESTQPWLEEIRNPLWHGTPQERSEEAYRQERTRASQERWSGLAVEGGEPTREFVDRIHAGATAFLAERGIARIPSELPLWSIAEPDRRIALVAHAGTNSVLIATLLGLAPTPWEWDRFVIGHGSTSRIESIEMGDGHTFCLSKLGIDEYLPVEDRTR